MGHNPTRQEPQAAVTDSHHSTQEKMRGECYVRLLVSPEANAARKDAVPYIGDTMAPDPALVQGGTMRVLTRKAVERDEDRDEGEEDDFERNDTVIFSFVR